MKIYIISLKSLVLAIAMLQVSTANALVISGSDSLTLSGYEAYTYAYNNASLTVVNGADLSYYFGHDNSVIDVLGGAISWLNLYDSTTAIISGGDIGWLRLYGNGAASLTGIDHLSWLLVSDNSKVDIYGENFSYASGHLSGFWEDGSAFSFWALEEKDLRNISIGNILPDNIVLHPVPEPASMSLLLVGLAALVALRKPNKARH